MQIEVTTLVVQFSQFFLVVNFEINVQTLKGLPEYLHMATANGCRNGIYYRTIFQTEDI